MTSSLVLEAPARAIRVAVLTVDHGLQAGSADRAARLVADLEGKVDHAEVLAVKVDGRGGPEAAARTARYAALDQAADRLGAVAIYLGHTAGDQAENVLLGLARGSGARSLAGMAAVSGRYRRPMLWLERDLVRRAGSENHFGITPWDDPHNEDPRFLRSRVRTRVLPILEEELGPGIEAALARTARLLREDADALDALAAAAVRLEGGALDISALARLSRAIRARVILSFARQTGLPALSAEHVDRVDALIADWRGQGAVALPGGAKLRREGMQLIIDSH
jgi:tRNA(Ile)-lysidine synthase